MSPGTMNVLLIICDDLAWGDVAFHGNPAVRTPHLDRLASQSVALTRYGSGPLCTPARAALMTGRHPYRTRAIDTYLGRSMLDPSEVTLPSLLRNQGYRTGIFGKWHLGDCYPMRAMDHGFEEALVHNGGGLRQPANLGRDSYFDPELMHNGQLEAHQGYCSDIFARAATNWIGQHRDQPFFCYLAFNAPHTPLEVDEALVEPYRRQGIDENAARIYAMTQNIDANVGAVLDELDRLELSESTLVIFMSDHGPCPSSLVGHDGQKTHRFNDNLRGHKGQMYEGGLRVPCLWHLPGQLQRYEVDRVANPIDVMPTLAEICRFSLPDDRVIDGRSLAPLLRHPDHIADWPDRTLCMQWHRGDVPELGRNAVAFSQHWKWYRPDPSEPAQLFDLQQDPLEQHDCAAQFPQQARDMEACYREWFEDVSSTRPNNYAVPRIIVGHQAEPVTALTWQDWRLYPEVKEEGWGADRPGFWEIHVADDGTYQIRIELVEPIAGRLHFSCGEHARQIELCPMTQTYQFDAELAAGDQRLEAYLDISGQRFGVDRVIVAHRGLLAMQ